VPLLIVRLAFASQEHRVSVAHPPATRGPVLPLAQKLLFHVKVAPPPCCPPHFPSLCACALNACVISSRQAARPGLCEVVTDAIRKQVRASSVAPAQVPVDVVDAIIRREYSQRGQGVTMYIMNPEAVQALAASAADESRAFRCARGGSRWRRRL
jgi:hypothetical protein